MPAPWWRWESWSRSGSKTCFARAEARRAEYDRYVASLFDFNGALAENESSLSQRFGAFREYYALAMGAATPPPNDGDVGGFMTLAVYASLGRHHDWRPAMARVRAPTLVLHGAGDFQPEADTRAFAAAIPGARVQVVSGASHFMPDDAPEAFARAIAAFIEETSGAFPQPTGASSANPTPGTAL